MSIPIECDRRYKINQQIYDEIKKIYKKWNAKKDISQTKLFLLLANKYKVSYHTIYYWLKEDYRKKKRAKNANKTRTLSEEEKRAQNMIKRRKELWREVPYTYIQHAVTSAKNEKRANRKTVYGKPISYWETYLKKFKRGGIKIKE